MQPPRSTNTTMSFGNWSSGFIGRFVTLCRTETSYTTSKLNPYAVCSVCSIKSTVGSTRGTFPIEFSK